MPQRALELILPTRRRFTRHEYERFAEMGVIGPDESLELIEGEVVRKMTQNSPHTTGVQLAGDALRAAFASGHVVRIQAPLALDDYSEPEPDVAVVTGSARDFANEHPTTAVLVVEVADSSLAVDRTTKANLYARAGVAEYWIINLQDRTLEVHRQPGPMAEQPLGHAYRHVVCLTESERIAPLAALTVSLLVSDLLP